MTNQEQVEALKEALVTTMLRRDGDGEPCWCAYAQAYPERDRMPAHGPDCEAVRAALKGGQR